jgi:PAS domain S-box-containing protein
LSRKKQKTSFDPFTGPLLIVDRDDLLLRANRAFYKTSSLDPASAAGRPLTEIMHPDGHWEACEICLARLKSRSANLNGTAASASPDQIEICAHDIHTAQGERLGTALVVCDLTVTNRPEPEGARVTALLKHLVDQAYDAVFTTDLDGRFLWANKRAADLLGLDGSALEGVPYLKSVHTDDLDRVRSAFDLASRGEAQRFEAQFLTGGYGSPRAVLVTNSPMYADDRVVAVLGIMRDVTEERHERDHAMRSDKLRALGQLAWGVGHNFNNSLTVVLGYTQLVLKKVDDPVIERHLRTVENAALDAAKLVQRIQDFARQSKVEQSGPVDLNQTIRDALDVTRLRWRDDAGAAGIAYDIIFRPKEGVITLGDQSALRAVCVSIIINALDAMPGGGRLVISTAVENGKVLVTFADTGSGMTEETRRRIFEPFYTTKGAKGHGLGLALTYGIIERHGGDIEVTSKPGAGAMFVIRLDRSPEPDSASITAWQDREPRPSSILVVDDEAPIRVLLSDMLRARGHAVLTAEDALSGLRALEDTRFDLVITDLSMPGTDGWTVVSEARRRWPGVKLVIVTGYGAFAELAVPGGDTSVIDALISKPFNIAEIDQTINRLLTRRE